MGEAERRSGIADLYKDSDGSEVSTKSEWNAQASPSSLSLPQIFLGKPPSIIVWASAGT